MAHQVLQTILHGWMGMDVLFIFTGFFAALSLVPALADRGLSAKQVRSCRAFLVSCHPYWRGSTLPCRTTDKGLSAHIRMVKLAKYMCQFGGTEPAATPGCTSAAEAKQGWTVQQLLNLAAWKHAAWQAQSMPKSFTRNILLCDMTRHPSPSDAGGATVLVAARLAHHPRLLGQPGRDVFSGAAAPPRGSGGA